MGLDQYAFAVAPHKGNTDFSYYWNRDTEDEVDFTPVTELAYWRKHPNLQGWMRELWTKKMYADGAVEEILEIEFNCQPIRLTVSDLDELEEVVNNAQLPETVGFFFGDNSDDDYKEADLEFIKAARKAISQDMEIYYDSWW